MKLARSKILFRRERRALGEIRDNKWPLVNVSFLPLLHGRSVDGWAVLDFATEAASHTKAVIVICHPIHHFFSYEVGLSIGHDFLMWQHSVSICEFSFLESRPLSFPVILADTWLENKSRRQGLLGAVGVIAVYLYSSQLNFYQALARLLAYYCSNTLGKTAA